MKRGWFFLGAALLTLLLAACWQRTPAETPDDTPPPVVDPLPTPEPDAPGEPDSSPEPQPISLEHLTIELVLDWEKADGMLSRLEELQLLLQDALAEKDCLVEEITVTINTAGGFTAQALTDGGVDAAILPAADYVSHEDGTLPLLTSGEDLCETVAAVSQARSELDEAFCQALSAALTDTQPGQDFLAACRPEAVFSTASEEALQAVRDHLAEEMSQP